MGTIVNSWIGFVICYAAVAGIYYGDVFDVRPPLSRIIDDKLILSTGEIIPILIYFALLLSIDAG